MGKNDIPVPKDGAHGFTLVELLIAISILAYGLLAVASMQIAGIHGNASAKWHTKGATWGADRIEKLIALDYDHDDLAAGSHGPVSEDDYAISWTVTDDTPIDNCKTIDIDIVWQDKGKSRGMSLIYNRADI